MVSGITVGMMVKNPPIARMAGLVALLRPFVSEFVIVNTGSTDIDHERMVSWSQSPEGTPVNVVREEFEDFSATRNKGLALHQHEWTLILDPDEIPSFAMLEHIKHVTSPEGMAENAAAKGWQYFTYNWWTGMLGPEMPYHWHTRLFRTYGSQFYKPVHELVRIEGVDELSIRNQPQLPQAPKSAYLIHSKGEEDLAEADRLYERLGEVSR